MKKTHSYCGLFLIFLTLCCFYTNAQTAYWPFNNYTNRYGLNEKFVYTSTQDQKGFIWIGASSGLYRFDGFGFKKVKSNADVPGHQIGNILRVIYPDKDGQLLLSSLNSFQKFDPVKNTFKSFSNINSELDKLINEDKVRCCFRDSKNKLWLGTENNYWCEFDEQKFQLKMPKGIKNTSLKTIFYIDEISDQNLLIVGTSGVFIYNKKTGQVLQYTNNKFEFTAAFYDAKNECVWLSSAYRGIVQFNLLSKQYLNFPTAKDFYASSLIPKNDSEIWIGGYQLSIFHKKSQRYTIIESALNDEFAFKTPKITNLQQDKEGNLWISSHYGLAQLAWQNTQVKTIPLKHPNKSHTIEPNETIQIPNCKDLLIANNSSRGLIRWHAEGNYFTEICNPKNKNKTDEFKGMKCVHATSDEKIYCGDEKGLYFVNPSNNTLLPLSIKDQNGIEIGSVYQIISDKKEQLYLFSPDNGFYIFDTKNSKLIHFSSSQLQRYIGIDNRKINIKPEFVDSKDNIWFVNTNGVLCFRPQDKHFIAYAQKPAANNGAKIILSYSICEDKNGHYWISTVDNGIYELTIVKGKEKLINFSTSTKPSLPSDYCKSLICDKKGKLWIGSLAGILRWDPNQYKIESILTRQNGLFQSSFDVSINELPDNQLAINNYSALNIITTSDYLVNNKKAKICWDDISVSEKQFDITEDTIAFKLKHNDNYLNLKLSFLNFNNNNQNEFTYKLIGIDKEWVNTKNNQISYAKLPVGNYTFLAKGINNDGIESYNTLKLDLCITPPFWSAWWFYAAIGALISIIIYALYRYRIQQIRKEENLKTEFNKRIANVEMQALRAQMNPHFIFNSLNSIQKFILKNDSFEASQYLTKFSKLIRLFLDQSKQNYILLNRELEMLGLYLEIESLRFDNAFAYSIIIEKDVAPEQTSIPSMLIQPYVENAIWHGLLHKQEKGHLKIHIGNHQQNSIVITVEDDGIGRTKAQELKSKHTLKAKSYGTQITHDRIEILNKLQDQKASVTTIDLYDHFGQAIGTKVVMNIPITKQES